MQEEMETSYQVNRVPETLALETHTARLTGVLVYLAGISPLMRGPLKSREPHAIRQPSPCPSLPSVSCLDLWIPTWFPQDAGTRYHPVCMMVMVTSVPNFKTSILICTPTSGSFLR